MSDETAMNPESTESKLARWLPLFVGICVAMPSIVLWWTLAAKERANIEHTVRLDAERVANEITERVRQQSLAFVRMARRREVRGEVERKVWEDDARLYYEHFPGTQGVTYVDRSYRIRWLIPMEGNEPALGLYLGFEKRRLRAMEEARRLREVRITSPIDLVQGGKGIIIFAPIYSGDRFEGFIDGVYRTQDFLGSILRNIAPGYFISVRGGEEEIFRRGEPAESVAKWGQEKTISLYGADWRVRVVPTRSLLGGIYSAVDALLIAGVAMALIFALVVRLAQTTRRRAEESEAAAGELKKEIGRREQAQVTLRESEARYRSLVNNIPDVLWTSDISGKTVFISPNFERVYGYPVSEIYEKAGFWFEGIHTDDLESVEKAYEELVSSNVMFDIEYRFRKKDGTWMWVRDRAVNSYEKNGTVYVDGMFTDITGRKQAEEALGKSRDFYLTLFDNFPTLIWRAGTDKKCDYFNRTWLEFTGRSLEQELGDGWAEGVHPYDLERCYATYAQAFDHREPFEMEYRLMHRSGEYRWIVDFGRPFHDLDGEFAGYIGSCYDITDRRKADEEIRRLKAGNKGAGLV